MRDSLSPRATASRAQFSADYQDGVSLAFGMIADIGTKDWSVATIRRLAKRLSFECEQPLTATDAQKGYLETIAAYLVACANGAAPLLNRWDVWADLDESYVEVSQ